MDASEDPPVRYDDLAEGYARHWGPVIRPAAESVVDHVAGPVPPGSRIIDVGTGTGTLAIAALERWPGVRVTGIDPSGAMLEIARRDARERLPEPVAERLETLTGLADRLPFDDATFDLAVSSFVLQLVPNRAAALREIRRVLRPGGRFAWLTWLVGGGAFRPDAVVDEVLGQFGFDPPEHDERSGDLASVAAAASATRRAGFGEVLATASTLQHTWTANGYAAFIAEFDEETLFSDLERDERRRIERRLREHLGRLTPEELTVRLPIVYVTGVATGTAPDARPTTI